MKIDSVRIDNYRGIESLELPLDPRCTVLFGPNGCGKSSVLTAIAVALSEDQQGPEFERPELDQRRGAAGGSALRLDLCPSPRPVARDYGVRVSLVQDSNERRWHREIDPVVRLPDCVSFGPARDVVATLCGREVAPGPDLNRFFDWFYVEETRELRARRDRGIEELPTVSSVRRAICDVLAGDDSASRPDAIRDASGPRPGFRNPRIVHDEGPPRLTVTVDHGQGVRDLAFEQLGDGYRGVIAVAAEIARRLAERDQTAENPLVGEMIVLIDEVEVHLHPEWQQRVLPDLTRTFPNVQFVVSTHSPQVLTTVHPEQIVELAWQDGRVVAGSAPVPTYGAEAGYVLSALMNVDRRPPNDFARTLRTYMRLVDDGKGESEQALELRKALDDVSHGDPGLGGADMEIRRLKMLRDMGES